MGSGRLSVGEHIRVRLEGSSEWTFGVVAVASDVNPQAVVLALDGVVRAPHRALVGNILPLTIDYDKETVISLVGGYYEIEVLDTDG
jgi:hypothetical protein